MLKRTVFKTCTNIMKYTIVFHSLIGSLWYNRNFLYTYDHFRSSIIFIQKYETKASFSQKPKMILLTTSMVLSYHKVMREKIISAFGNNKRKNFIWKTHLIFSQIIPKADQFIVENIYYQRKNNRS